MNRLPLVKPAVSRPFRPTRRDSPRRGRAGWLVSLPEGGTKGQAIEPEGGCTPGRISSSSQILPSSLGEPPSARCSGFLSKHVVRQFKKMETWLKLPKGETCRGRVTEGLSDTFDLATIPWEFSPRK